MKIFLVRHGEAIGNVDKSAYIKVPDQTLPLTLCGKTQAWSTGIWLANNLPKRKWHHIITGRDPRARFWTSPYARTRQTLYSIEDGINFATSNHSSSLIRDTREHILLSEQQFGLFDGLSTEELEEKFPNEHAHYDKHEKVQARFWARMPLGESRFDVAVRVHQAFGTFQRDADRHGIDTIVVICHGVTMRAFVMMWCHKSSEWFDQTPNPPNGAVWLLDDHVNHGIVFVPNNSVQLIDEIL